MFDIPETPGDGLGLATKGTRESATCRPAAPTERDGRSERGRDAPEVPAVAADQAMFAPRKSATRTAPDPHPHPASNGGETTATWTPPVKAIRRTQSSQPSPKGARAAKSAALETANDAPPRAIDDHDQRAGARQGHTSCVVIEGGGHLGVAENGHAIDAAPSPLNASPLVAEIVETWRQRQAMVEARKRLILQAKALCRRMTRGDKAEADALYAAGDPILDPFEEAMAPFTVRAAALDRHMVKLAKRLPVADFAASVKGFGHPGLSKAVGELGDLSCYEKGVSGIWKRAGLAVIDGQRQRRVTGSEAAAAHGYAPARRSVFWNIAAAMLKGQGTGDASGPYRLIYDARKAYERPRVESDGHAHNRAMRYMTKRLLRDLHNAWRDA